VNFRFPLESPRGHCSRLRPCTFKRSIALVSLAVNISVMIFDDTCSATDF
jgi:hypothetical protein